MGMKEKENKWNRKCSKRLFIVYYVLCWGLCWCRRTDNEMNKYFMWILRWNGCCVGCMRWLLWALCVMKNYCHLLYADKMLYFCWNYWKNCVIFHHVFFLCALFSSDILLIYFAPSFVRVIHFILLFIHTIFILIS